jgi:glycosyltransferase involved in cell wall biosynthesis
MKIGIDARLIEETGVGRYIRNLIVELSQVDHEHEYVVFLRKKSFSSFELPGSKWKKVLADMPWHSMAEQLRMPGIFSKEKLDILHVPYFNVPLLYTGKMIVTIHDLIILHFDTGKASTHSWLFYKIRRLGYRLSVWWGLHRAVKIIAVSQATKDEIVSHFSIDPSKIIVTYEGVDKSLKKLTQGKKVHKRLIKDPYFLYVGNAYPHKNLETLLAAFEHMDSKSKLVLVGKDDFFYRRLKIVIGALGISDHVDFFGQATDDELASLYAHAKALVFPSLMEGFGLPALEALAMGCPVICSDIPVFREILGNNAMYFNPRDAHTLSHILMGPIKKPAAFDMSTYNWSTMAQDTKKIYEDSIRL